jgi:hypothetical protein
LRVAAPIIVFGVKQGYLFPWGAHEITLFFGGADLTLMHRGLCA